MQFDPENSNDETMKFVIKNRKDEVNKERLAEMINSLEDLSIFHNTMPDPEMKKEIKGLIDEIIQAAKGYDVPRTLQKFYTLRDTNAIFDYIRHMRQDIVVEGEEL